MKIHAFALSFLLIINTGFGQQLNPLSLPTDEQLQLISTCAQKLPNQAQLSIAIIKDGEVNFYGVKKEDDSLTPIDNAQKVFEIGSITKVFTATLLAKQVLENKVKLDDDINDYLDYSLKDNTKITFEQLATHTSGLPRVPISLSSPTLNLENPYKDYDKNKLKIYLTEKLILDAAQGEKSSYSNLGFGLLGYLEGLIENSSYEDLLQNRIFSKYHMDNSTTDRNAVQHILVKGLNDNGQEVPNWDMAVHMGAGGILSTVEDLSKFALAQFDNNNKELNLTRQAHFKIEDNYSIGLAWGLIKVASGEEWIWHNGGTGGYTSSMIINTNTKNGIIILSNISALGKLTSNIGDLSHELMTTLEQ
ncbi:serine hydrolase domain-containing protein [Echinicola salinicaeni]|uniref:serine hydrolase domain-containing protein n=1 Tax=Echinicola salinicaeni TaxID=2762757 RepID=UPI001645A9A3|nr:serine hydrolase domain-containing protein [Echinicola salinicaeni]